MKILTLIFILLLYPLFGQANCEKARQLTIKAADITIQQNITRQKALLQQALAICPDYPEALNNLGVWFENQQQLETALQYYQRALKVRPNFIEPWFGMGDVHQTQGQLPQALAAYLNICQQDKDAKAKVKKLLRKYQKVEKGQVFDKKSLLLLYDMKKHQAIAQKIEACGFQMRAAVQPKATFRNFLFDTAKANLKTSAQIQLQHIVNALQALPNNNVTIDGHTDYQQFKGHSKAESVILNQKLSEQRAASIKLALQQAGVTKTIKTNGYGSNQPIDSRHNTTAYQKNRRVEIYLK